jgi:hypothetical protein
MKTKICQMIAIQQFVEHDLEIYTFKQDIQDIYKYAPQVALLGQVGHSLKSLVKGSKMYMQH